MRRLSCYKRQGSGLRTIPGRLPSSGRVACTMPMFISLLHESLSLSLFDCLLGCKASFNLLLVDMLRPGGSERRSFCSVAFLTKVFFNDDAQSRVFQHDGAELSV